MQRPATLALVLALAGCDNLFNLGKVGDFTGDGRLGGDGAVDTFTPPDCSSVQFSTALPVADPSLQPLVGGDPWMNDNRLELFFVKLGTAPYEIWRATRGATTDGFQLAGARETFNVDGVDNAEPSMTADGKLLVFMVGSATGYHLYYTERSTTQTWTVPVPMPGLDSLAIDSAQIGSDGLTLYYVVPPDYHLVMATRSSRTAPFGAASELTSFATRFPTVSLSGRELYYDVPSGGIGRAVRGPADPMFGGEGPAFMFGSDPQLLSDATSLVIVYDSSIAVLERTCP